MGYDLMIRATYMMANVTVLQELLEWSQDRPAWQRDALRRLVLHGELSDDDISALTGICKSAHGLAEQELATPLATEHVPEKIGGSAPVSLVSIFHNRGVNALSENQTLKFDPNLTVVYGDNAAGKTGYIRILKSACRARGEEQILGNVVSGTAPRSPVVSIKYQIGPDEVQEWAGGEEDNFISRVSVFDTRCAAVYLTEKTDVAFRPFGLDLFDKLVKACRAVRAKLENEQRTLASSALAPLQRQVPEGTAVGKLLANISSLTSPELVHALARFSPEEAGRLAQLEKSLLDLQVNDPEKLIRQLTLRVGRVRALARHLNVVEHALSAQTVAAVFDTRAEVRRKSEEARRLRGATFSADLLPGTGSEPWTELWEAARRFSQQQAYPGQAFPVVEDGAYCVLCQQDLDHSAGHRLRMFENFVASMTEHELRQVRETFARLRESFTDLKTTTETTAETLEEIRIEHDAVPDAVNAALVTNESRRKAVVLALTEDRDLRADDPALVVVAYEVAALADQIEARINTLLTSATDETRKLVTVEAQELRARELLRQQESLFLDEIERKKKIAAYGLCMNDTTTNAITQKSTAVTKIAVSKKLKQRFKDELTDLGFRHVEVELKEAGGTEGVLYHKLILTRAPGVELPKVVSEGRAAVLVHSGILCGT